ncbi:MAG: hypothetical protein MUE44_33010 [Oscillatoriaceae cyanobacterium Prado104]|nr:hypothetical protein [Oscillatoriaceae cyanobacterium Prado104]
MLQTEVRTTNSFDCGRSTEHDLTSYTTFVKPGFWQRLLNSHRVRILYVHSQNLLILPDRDCNSKIIENYS